MLVLHKGLKQEEVVLTEYFSQYFSEFYPLYSRPGKSY